MVAELRTNFELTIVATPDICDVRVEVTTPPFEDRAPLRAVRLIPTSPNRTLPGAPVPAVRVHVPESVNCTATGSLGPLPAVAPIQSLPLPTKLLPWTDPVSMVTEWVPTDTVSPTFSADTRAADR